MSMLKHIDKLLVVLFILCHVQDPDLSHVVTELSQFMSNPNLGHIMTMAKHVLKYLRGTVDYKLVFRKSENPISADGLLK